MQQVLEVGALIVLAVVLGGLVVVCVRSMGMKGGGMRVGAKVGERVGGGC